MLVELKQKAQVTIPSEIVKKMKLNPGDKFEVEEKDGKIILTPVVVIPREQIWFYSKEWQQGEVHVEEDIIEGKFKSASTKEDLFKDLGLDE
ncbi:AbrB/MazE/SpoVT family DNA-binding domain-containing protein [Caldicellulosiruptoraceae bacterium PP1]